MKVFNYESLDNGIALFYADEEQLRIHTGNSIVHVLSK
jgi:hypothetical protein